ncbi:MAG TPA: outer membrane protein assembly factor BamD [Gemmatimonadales bacterium]|jgi:outer membrane protein assembly factor BamD|nr:outer membrane protein assembly factor BamD [Gemmatimonadales bacterium]
MSLRRTVWLVGVLGLAAGCYHRSPAGAAPRPVVRPEAELERALQMFRRGSFRRAQLILQRLTFEFAPSQPELATVRFYLAECYFQTGDRVQAAHEFSKVADDFPGSEYAPVALLRAGDSNLRLWRRAELDPTYGETALSIYQTLASLYPNSDAAARARLHVRRLQEQFAEKTYKNGMFYLKRKAYDSGIIYFKDVIANYPATKRAPDALLRLVDSYRAIGYTEELEETCAHLRRFYPTATGLDKGCPAPAPGAPS